MKIVRLLSAILFGGTIVSSSHAITLSDIQVWAGSGTNRAAMVLHWSAPEVHNNSTVPNPVAEKSLVWGYRWDGSATGADMYDAIMARDPRLFALLSAPAPWGTSIYAMGYDLNNNGSFGVKSGTNTIVNSYFTNGLHTFDGDADAVLSLDAGDMMWSGWSGAFWEMWHEQGGTGGFTNAPDRGASPYWTPADPTMPWFGSHGEWELAQTGLSGVQLQEGSWIGFSVAAGGFNFSDENDPGTIAYNLHKRAPKVPEAASSNTVYATHVIASQGPFGSVPYDEPDSTLGIPATRYYESSAKPATRVKLAEGIYNFGVENGQTNKLLVTLNTGSSIIARFDQPVIDDAANPYGIDFQVFGNTFFTASSFVGDTANLNNVMLTGGSFSEPIKVSVSPGFTGQPGEESDTPSTWPWYRYETGPYGDTIFPTQAYKWDRGSGSWTDELMDFTKPVNPVLKSHLTAGSLSVADGIDLYGGSGGGTGFDLGQSGFTSIQYVKVEGLSGFTGGEIDAFSIVRPMTIGDTLSIAPANLTNETAELFFQKPGQLNQTALSLSFSALTDIALVSAAPLDDTTALAAVAGLPLNALHTELSPVLGTSEIEFTANLRLFTAEDYAGNGSDLRVSQWSGTNWASRTFTFDSTNKQVLVAGVTNLSPFVVAHFPAPQLQTQVTTNGLSLHFTALAHCSYTLERSLDLTSWEDVTNTVRSITQPASLQDSAAPASKAFYRLRLNP